MSETNASSYYLDEEGKTPTLSPTSLNDRLQTQHIDVLEDDSSVDAYFTRTVTQIVGKILSPRQVLVILRLLKAITLCFIPLNLLANVMFLVFVESLGSSDVRSAAGGVKDIVIRLYGLGLSFVALAIELNHARIEKRFHGLRGFIPRSFLLFFIATITGSQHIYSYRQSGSFQSQVPSSAVGFQRVTAMVLAICALAYFLAGVLCLDRFTARAFLSTADPRVTTSITHQT